MTPKSFSHAGGGGLLCLGLNYKPSSASGLGSAPFERWSLSLWFPASEPRFWHPPRFGKAEMLFLPNGYPGSSCRQDDLPAILRFRPDLLVRKKAAEKAAFHPEVH